MSKSFQPLKVKQLIRETAEATTIVFEKPADGSFEYKAGQYITLKVKVGNEELRRAYSICTSPATDADLAVTVKAVSDGRASVWLNSFLAEGQVLEVFPPLGRFTASPDASTEMHYVLLAGGSGITPVISILKTVLSTAPKSKVTLFYNNRNEESIIFKKQLDELQAAHSGRLRIVHLLAEPSAAWMGLRGRLDRRQTMTFVQELMSADSMKKQFYLCGPGGMMEEVLAALNFLGIAKTDIFRELFSSSPDLPQEEKPLAKHTVVSKSRGTYPVKVILDGKEYGFTVDAKTTILEAAVNAGIDPPFACQMGVCCTCRGKLLSGSVEMDENEGLSDQEIEEGYVLTCQSHPLTPDVVVEYM